MTFPTELVLPKAPPPHANPHPEPQGEGPAHNTGLWCLSVMAQLHGIAVDGPALEHEFGASAFDIQTVLLAAQKLGMSAKCVAQDVQRLGAWAAEGIARMESLGILGCNRGHECKLHPLLPRAAATLAQRTARLAA